MNKTDRPRFRQRLGYTVDLILSKGVFGVFLLSVIGTLLILFVLVPVLLALQIVTIGKGSWSDVPGLIWTDFAQVFKLGKAQGPWVDQLGTALIALLGIFFTGILFGILVKSVGDKVSKLRETGGQIIAEHHTAVVGWSSIGETVLEQLALANANRRKPVVAVLDTHSKLANETATKDLDTRNTVVMFRKGKPIKPADLDIIRVDLADHVIVMADWAADNYDEQIITELLALSRYKDKHPNWNSTVVATLKNGQNTASAEIAAEFPVVILDVRKFLSRLMLRTTLQPGLYSVYTDLFNFGGDELYFTREPNLIGKTLGEALSAYPDSSPVGIKTPQGAFLHPDLGTVIGPEDQLVLITRDDDTAIVGPVAEFDESAILSYAAPVSGVHHASRERWLFVGWSPTLGDFLHELDSYSPETVEADIVCREGDVDRISQADTAHGGIKVTVSEWPDHVDPSQMLHDKKLSSFDYVVIFNQTAEPDSRDRSTFMVMLQASAIAQSLPEGQRPAIVTELIEPKLRKLCKPGLGDIVVDSEIVALMTAQLSENPDLLPIMVDLCDAGGSEIYLKDAGIYLRPGPVNYATAVESARRRGEIAIGYLRRADAKNARANFGILINPNKNSVIEFEAGDQLIVIAEDQF